MNETCKRCGSQIHPEEKNVWVDNSGGDVCGWNGGNEPHKPVTPEKTTNDNEENEPRDREDEELMDALADLANKKKMANGDYVYDPGFYDEISDEVKEGYRLARELYGNDYAEYLIKEDYEAWLHALDCGFEFDPEPFPISLIGNDGE